MTEWALAFGLVMGSGVAVIVFHRTLAPPTPLTSSSPSTPWWTKAVVWGEARLRRAGWSDVSAPTAMVLWVVASVLVGAVVAWVMPLVVLGPLATAAMILGGVGVLNARIERHDRQLRAVWPGLVDHLRQAVRSGAGVGEAVWALADVTSGELREACVAYRAALESGATVSQALSGLKADLSNPVADRIIEALRMAHEVGGPELPRILTDLHDSVRADWQVREDALAKQAWIRAASKLGVAAPWIVLVLISGRPETYSAYSEPAGVLLLLVGAGVSAVAFSMMRRLGTLPQEKRWLA